MKKYFLILVFLLSLPSFAERQDLPSCNSYEVEEYLLRMNIGMALFETHSKSKENQSIVESARNTETQNEVEFLLDAFYSEFPGDYKCVDKEDVVQTYSEAEQRETIAKHFN